MSQTTDPKGPAPILIKLRQLDEEFSRYKPLYFITPLLIFGAVSFVAQNMLVGVALGAAGGLALYLGMSHMYARKALALAMPAITGLPASTWTLTGQINNKRYDALGLRTIRSKEVKFRGELSAGIDGIPFKIIQMGDSSGRKKAGSGLMVEIDQKNNIQSNVLIISEGTLSKALTRLNKDASLQKGFTDPEFEKMFEVYARDGVEAHYMLNPVAIEKLKALHKEYNGDQIEAVLTPSDDIFYIATQRAIFPRFYAPAFKRDENRQMTALKECRKTFQALLETVKSFSRP